MSKVQSVVFDMDGVIVDSHPVHRMAWREFLQSLGKDVSDEQLDFIVDGRKRSEILRHFLGDVPESALVEYGRQKDEFFQRIAFQVKPVPGVIEFVENLIQRGIKLGVATSASEFRALSTLRHLHLTDCFAAVVTGDDVPEGKSSPAIYELVCTRLCTEARYCVVVEDSVSAVRAAKEAGCRCVGVGSRRATLWAAGADHVIEDFVGFSLDALEPRAHAGGPLSA